MKFFNQKLNPFLLIQFTKSRKYSMKLSKHLGCSGLVLLLVGVQAGAQVAPPLAAPAPGMANPRAVI